MTITRRRVVIAALVVVAGLVAAVGFAAHQVLSPTVAALPAHADAVVVFAGEDARLDLAERLVAEGHADALVISNGEHSSAAARCGQQEPVVVLCPRPGSLDTRGEARMFAQVARDHGWHDLIAVTGNYHVARARLLLERCWPEGVTFAPVPWRHVRAGVVLHEIGGLVDAVTVDRTC